MKPPIVATEACGFTQSKSSLIRLQWRLDTDAPHRTSLLFCCSEGKILAASSTGDTSVHVKSGGCLVVRSVRPPPPPPRPHPPPPPLRSVRLLRAVVMRRGWVIQQSLVFRSDWTADAHHHSDVACVGERSWALFCWPFGPPPDLLSKRPRTSADDCHSFRWGLLLRSCNSINSTLYLPTSRPHLHLAIN